MTWIPLYYQDFHTRLGGHGHGVGSWLLGLPLAPGVHVLGKCCGMGHELASLGEYVVGTRTSLPRRLARLLGFLSVFCGPARRSLRVPRVALRRARLTHRQSPFSADFAIGSWS